MGLCTKRSFDCRAFTLPVSDVKRRGSCGAKSSRQLSEQGMSHQHQGYRDRRHVVAARRAELRFCKAIRNRSTPTPALEEYFMKYKPTKGLVCRPWGKTRPQLSDKTCKREVRHLAAAGRDKPTNPNSISMVTQFDLCSYLTGSQNQKHFPSCL